MKQILIISQLIKFLVLIALFYLIKKFTTVEFGNYAKYLFVIYIFLQKIFNAVIYQCCYKQEKKSITRYLTYLIFQLLLILCPVYFCINNCQPGETSFIIFAFTFSIIIINIISDYFEIAFFRYVDKKGSEIKKLPPQKIILLLKNYLIVMIVIMILAIIFTNELLFFLINVKLPDLEIILVYLFFTYGIIYFVKYHLLFAEVFRKKTNYSIMIYLLQFIIYILFSILIISTDNYYKYIYSAVISSTLALFILYFWTIFLKLEFQFHYSYYWRILVVYLAYYTFLEYFIYSSIFLEIIVRTIYFISIFLSIYLCQCYSLEEEKLIKKSLKFFQN